MDILTTEEKARSMVYYKNERTYKDIRETDTTALLGGNTGNTLVMNG